MRRISGVVGLAIAFLACGGAVTAQAPKVASFTIEVVLSSFGAQMKCVEGCVWEKTSYRCDGDEQECRFVVDQEGIEGRR